MANTTWSTTDKSPNVTLTGSNLIATATSTAVGARAADRQITGKFYWENTVTVWIGPNTSVGFCNSAVPLTAMVAAPVGSCNVIKSGVISINGAASGSTLGTLAAGNVIGIAIDLNAQLGWLRLAPSGNWNGSSTANPATGVGGISLSGITGGGLYSLYPVCAFGGGSDSTTANFGDTAFSGTVPSGFTSGFTAGAALPLTYLAGIGREALVSSPGQMRLGGLAREALVSGVGLSGRVTSRSLGRGDVALAFAVVNLAGNVTARSQGRATGPGSFIYLGGQIRAGSSLVGVIPSTGGTIDDSAYVVTVIT